MKFTVDTEREQVDLTASTLITLKWQQMHEADRRGAWASAEALKEVIKRYLDNAAHAVPGNDAGHYRVVWGREQVIAILPLPTR